MTEILRPKSTFLDMFERIERGDDKITTNRDSAQPVAVFSNLDPRTAKMLDIFLQDEFNSTGSIQRMRLNLMSWVIRAKLLQSSKRIFDLVIASLSLLLFSPVMAITAVLIRLDSPGPVIYKQVRVGKWGRRFNCFKFRSMYIDADARKAELMAQNEADEIVFKIRRDPRVTRLGRVIRKLSIDELPQIFNVLRGDMSVVGPRPPVPYEVERYKYEYFHRLDAIPGITGLQQISGRSDVEFKRWIELDLQYIQEQSLAKDIQILLLTIPTVISGRGAY